ncbi:hypothetical protein M409DRAFT_30187 [Zasmidium cellare ATCC 36951]|uniref:Zn(2)-C6 fungal-type domain-containing protein n=1 Tax=Zasmidium cellare ATCC 36951 TaxID=1080233 RepID=A0A6A6BZI4_ZASCE|nr:uncharacterized protein M409DRAFT_30187 [Zasmidium cellare ATCC 36951]KAF2159310.1 hypothetical protein M409DRAFT_30187 [Zasmidium cellare ATCC 36951]
MNTRRRNGKVAACEPCRKSKSRCDHVQDVCGPCTRRGIQTQCYYHPSPLTRTKFSLYQNPNLADSPSSLVGLPSPPANTRSPTLIPNPILGSDAPWPSKTEAEIAEFLVVFRPYWPALRTRLHGYYEISLAPLVPKQLTFLLAEGVEQDCISSQVSVDLLARAISKATSSPSSSLEIAHNPEAWIKQHTTPVVSLQAIGLLCAIAGRAAVSTPTEPDSQQETKSRLLSWASLCLSTARTICAAEDDIFLWLAYDHLKFNIAVMGMYDRSTWHLLSQLVADTLSAGLNREVSLGRGVPFFVVEMRRRLLLKVYHADKLISLVLDRAPRLSHRYIDIALPLDLADEDLLQETAIIPKTSDFMSDDGWNVQPSFNTASWLRAFHCINIIREEVLDWEATTVESRKHDDLLSLSKRAQFAWQSIPNHLQYQNTCWLPGLRASTVTMLAFVKLAHLQNLARIQRLLGQDDTVAPATVALDILTVVNDFGMAVGSPSTMRHDFELVVIYYGLPNAASLLEGVSRPSPMRVKVVRTLSVFVEHLDHFTDASGPNHKLLSEASALLSKALDHIIVDDASSFHMAAGSVLSDVSFNTIAAACTATPQSSRTPGDQDERSPLGHEAADQSFSDLISSVDWSIIDIDWSAV